MGECISLAKQHNFKTTRSTEWMDDVLDSMGEGGKVSFSLDQLSQNTLLLWLS